ncbi:MAG: ABC transporter permease [Bacteroidota bacterium]
MLQIILYNFEIALQSILQNKLRSLLTSLGIIFGVASVITMLAIGKGAEQEVLEQMSILGTNNIIVRTIVEQTEGEVQEDQQEKDGKRFSPGLSLEDMESIREIPHVAQVTPEIIYETLFIRSGLKRTGKMVGVNRDYFAINNFELDRGELFTPQHVRDAMQVCIIGSDIATKFFAGTNPIGKKIKSGPIWLTVVGVLKKRSLSSGNIDQLGIRNYNLDIYIPATSALLRYKNRSLVTKQDIQQASRGDDDEESDVSKNYHQVDKIIAQVDDTKYSTLVSDVISRMLTRRHNDVVDFEVVVPELLLQQEQRTKRIFNIVLSSIASISLIVGGIGIMNIMLASVVERIREIGVRMAIGAQKRDITLQFLTEALTICIVGGVIGIALGFVLSYGIQEATQILTIVSPISIVISFGVALAIGVIFGLFPAKRAADLDPATALRHE